VCFAGRVDLQRVFLGVARISLVRVYYSPFVIDANTSNNIAARVLAHPLMCPLSPLLHARVAGMSSDDKTPEIIPLITPAAAGGIPSGRSGPIAATAAPDVLDRMYPPPRCSLFSGSSIGLFFCVFSFVLTVVVVVLRYVQ
jgi:hypothetical protein